MRTQQRAARQTVVAQRDGLCGTPGDDRRHGRKQTHRLFQARAQPGQRGQVLGLGQARAQHCIHFGLGTLGRSGVFSDKVAPPQQGRRTGLVAGLEAHHALVEDLLVVQRLTRVFVAQGQQHGQQIDVGGQRVRPAACDVAAHNPPQLTQRGTLGCLARQWQPVGQRQRPKHLTHGRGRQQLHGPRRDRGVVAGAAAEKCAQDDVHRQAREQRLHVQQRACLAGRHGSVQAVAGGLHHQLGVAGGTARREGGLQHALLTLPRRAFGDQHSGRRLARKPRCHAPNAPGAAHGPPRPRAPALA